MNRKKRILVAGGAGYIGSHTCLELLIEGWEVIVLDNLCNSKKESLTRIQQIAGRNLEFHQLDLLDKDSLDDIFSNSDIDAVIHFAGLKAVGESVSRPLRYYTNNIIGSLNLFEVMKKHNVRNLVFSSSATVYGDPHSVPITEEFPVGEITNPYGRTKWMIEEMLTDLHRADPEWNIVILRYFNPVGAHESGEIGEDPNDIPNNLMPYISQVAAGKLPELQVFGNDYSTSDGTGVRDYIHVVDLSKGHLRSLVRISDDPGLVIYNLGTGNGYSVLEMISAFEQASGKAVPYKIVGRRTGDIASCYADPTKANQELGWKAELGLNKMCESAWNWQSNNPYGYGD